MKTKHEKTRRVSVQIKCEEHIIMKIDIQAQYSLKHENHQNSIFSRHMYVKYKLKYHTYPKHNESTNVYA